MSTAHREALDVLRAWPAALRHSALAGRLSSSLVAVPPARLRELRSIRRVSRSRRASSQSVSNRCCRSLNAGAMPSGSWARGDPPIGENSRAAAETGRAPRGATGWPVEVVTPGKCHDIARSPRHVTAHRDKGRRTSCSRSSSEEAGGERRGGAAEPLGFFSGLPRRPYLRLRRSLHASNRVLKNPGVLTARRSMKGADSRRPTIHRCHSACRPSKSWP